MTINVNMIPSWPIRDSRFMEKSFSEHILRTLNREVFHVLKISGCYRRGADHFDRSPSLTTETVVSVEETSEG